MDNLLYVILTNIAIFVSLIGIIVIVTAQIIKKKKISTLALIMLLIFVCGIYLYIPFRYTYLGYATQQPHLLKKAIIFSINPYEKRLCNKYIAEIYANDIFNQGIKDGNKAITYMEKAVKGKYKKYKAETYRLAYWYSIKGDYKKTFDLCMILSPQQGLPLRNIYILNNEYKKALITFSDKNISEENFLKAALYKEIGENEKAISAENIATKTYNIKINNINEKSKKIKFEEETNKYRTIDGYKNWLNEQAKELKFK